MKNDSKMVQLKTSFYIRRSRKLSNGKCPIYCRLTIKRKRAEFAVNKSVDEKLWIPSAGRAKGNSIDAFRLNKHLEKINIYLAEKKVDLRGLLLEQVAQSEHLNPQQLQPKQLQ